MREYSISPRLETVLPDIEADAAHWSDGCNADLPFLLPR